MDSFDLRQWPGFSPSGGNLQGPTIIDQVSIDSRRIDSKNALFVALPGVHNNGHKFLQQAAEAGAQYALVKKDSVSLNFHERLILLRVDDPLKSFQEIAGIYRREKNCKVIGITGSYGKTMVKDLLHAILGTKFCVTSSPESFNSQIGVPLSLLQIKSQHQVAIIEAGISEKNEMDSLQNMITPDYGILTCIGKKHIATLGDLTNIASEMMKLFLQTTNWVLLPANFPLESHKQQMKAQTFNWNEKTFLYPEATYQGKTADAKQDYTIKFPSGTHFQGKISKGFTYFLDLVNIVIKAAWLFEIPEREISRILNDYTVEPMRTEIWKSLTGVTCINDTYCSDPQSVDQALKYFQDASPSGRKIFIFNGMKKPGDDAEVNYRRIGKAIHQADLDLLILTGNHAFDPLISEIKQLSPEIEIVSCPDNSTAFQYIQKKLNSDDTILIKGETKEPFENLTQAFNESICNNQCLINLAVIENNIALLRKKLPPQTRMMVMVKALAYGTDDVRMAHFLTRCGIDILGVSYIDEGVLLKRAGVKQSIFVINAAIYEAAKVVKWDLEVGVSESTLIEALAKEAKSQNKKIKVHLHVDTGMSRFGCRPEEALSLAQLILQFPTLELEGIMTHFVSAENAEEDHFTQNQIDCFDQIIAQLKRANIEPCWKHAANSSAALRFSLPQFNMVRLGLAIYGLYASEQSRKSLELDLALSLISRIVGINYCKPGESVSYGRSYTANKESKIGVLPIGYFDGLHRNYSGKGTVIIRGHQAPMIGKICMDYLMIDVTHIPNVAIGDPVLIFGVDEYGHYLSPEDLAVKGDSIVHELITCLGPRIQRVFIYEETRLNRRNNE